MEGKAISIKCIDLGDEERNCILGNYNEYFLELIGERQENWKA